MLLVHVCCFFPTGNGKNIMPSEMPKNATAPPPHSRTSRCRPMSGRPSLRRYSAIARMVHTMMKGIIAHPDMVSLLCTELVVVVVVLVELVSEDDMVTAGTE